MIVGNFTVNPLEVFYGKKEWIAEIPKYQVIIMLIDENGVTTQLNQWVDTEKLADELLKKVDHCINERKEEMIKAGLNNPWEEEDD